MEGRLDHVKQRLDVERRLGNKDLGARRGPFIPRAVKERSTSSVAEYARWRV